MSFTQQSKFPTLKQFLQEGEDDLFIGVRHVINDLRAAWNGGSRQEVDQKRKAALKKLGPEQNAALKRYVDRFLVSTLANLSGTPDYAIVTDYVSNFDEANAAVMVFMSLANGRLKDKNPQLAAQSKIGDLARYFLHEAKTNGVITDEEVKQHMLHVLSTTAYDKVGPEVVKVFKDNLEFFKRVFTLGPDVTIQPAAGAELLNKMLENTPDDKKKEAISKVIIGLQRLRWACMAMIDRIEAEGHKRQPAKPAASPADKDKHPATKPLPKV